VILSGNFVYIFRRMDGECPFPFFIMDAENKDISAGISDSDADAFGRLYEEYLQMIFRYVSYRVGDRTTAEDLTSDIFSKALAGFSRFDAEKASFSTWIYSIARNTVIDYYRKRDKEQKLQSKVKTETSAIEESPEEEVSRSEEISKLKECISRLSPTEQELISLKFSGEMTNREIARLTGLSESNVGTILFRAVRKLRDEFAEWQNEG
jgi:RNA polymerase sigma-70 factor (TIGR02952 family)